MSSLFVTRLWNHLVLPMSHGESAVTHAAVAVSTLHEDMKARGAPLSRENLVNHRHRFALEQYTRALSSLNARRHSKDPKLREVLLTCCLLFVFFELLRGQYDPAFAHLQWGLSIIKQLQANSDAKQKPMSPSSPRWLNSSSSNSPSPTEDIETSLVEAMSRLHYQSTFFGIDVSSSEAVVAESVPGDNGYGLDGFESIAEARKNLDGLFNKSCRVVSSYSQLSAEDRLLDSNRLPFERDQRELRIECANFSTRFNRSAARIHHPGCKESQRAIDLIRLYHKTSYLMLDTFIEREGVSYDSYTDDFRKLVTISERIADSFREGNSRDGGSRPALMLDIGIIPALTYVCMKCADTSLRRRALRMLEVWPHREGPWDSNLLAIMASELIQAETEAEMQSLPAAESAPTLLGINHISPSSRVANPSLIVQDDQTRAVLTYSKSGGEIKKWIMLD
jgi:Fungal specific transcription factor domain